MRCNVIMKPPLTAHMHKALISCTGLPLKWGSLPKREPFTLHFTEHS